MASMDERHGWKAKAAWLGAKVEATHVFEENGSSAGDAKAAWGVAGSKGAAQVGT